MLAPNYLFVHGSGKVGDRADFLAAFADPAETFTAFAITHRVVIPVGPDGAIVAAEANVQRRERRRSVHPAFPLRRHLRAHRRRLAGAIHAGDSIAPLNRV